MTADRATVWAALATLQRELGARPTLDPAAVGPCARCATDCRRYGDGAATLCPLCRQETKP